MRRTVRKSLLEEVQELEAQAVDPGAAVLRDASSRRYGHRRDFDGCAQSHKVDIYTVYKEVHSKKLKNFYSIVSPPSVIELIQFKLAI